MTTGLKADLFTCHLCERPLEATGKFKQVRSRTGLTRTFRELECGHFIPATKYPVFRRDPYAVRKER